MLILQDQERLSVWGQVLIRTSSGWWTADEKVSKEYDKSAVAVLKKGNWQEREPVTDECHDRPVKPGKRSDKKLGQKSSKRQSSDARQLGCVFQDITPPKSILRKGTDMPKPIQRVKFTKGYCTSYQNSRPKSFARLHLSRWTSMSVAPTIRNLRIVHEKRQSGKSKVPAKQRGSWPKVY